MNKLQRGGKRENSGRKPRKEPTKVFPVTLTLDYLAKAKLHRAEIRELVRAYIRFKKKGEGVFTFSYYKNLKNVKL